MLANTGFDYKGNVKQDKGKCRNFKEKES